jgi:predicted GIY-YIG superfamily endonuclease
MTAVNDSMALPPELLLNVERYAVYRCYADDGQLLYIGITGTVGRRLGDHLQKAWFTQVRGMSFEWYADELDARNAERRAIHVEHPKYNIVHRNSATPAPSAPRVRGARKQAVRGKLTLEEQAANLMKADPSLRRPRMGGELARRLGTSPATGGRLHRKLAGDGSLKAGMT